MQTRTSAHSLSLHLIMGLTLGAAMTLALSALADGDPTTDDVPRTLPYQGVLEFNGQPVNATGADAVHIQFALYDGQASEAPVYTQELAVEVYAGRFLTTIGPVGSGDQGQEVLISDLVANADDLYLGMVLLGDPEDPEDDIPLANRQRIHASPYALWSSTATNFTVANTFNVGGSASVGGHAFIGSGRPPASVAQLQLGQNVAAGAPAAFHDYQLLVHRQAEVAQSAGLGTQDGGDTLFLNAAQGLKVYQAGQERLRLDQSALHTGAIEAGGDITTEGRISGNFQLEVSGETSVGRDGSGTTSRDLGSTTRRICFLTKAGYKDIDSGSERADCQINLVNGRWRLDARLENTRDANAFCTARCLLW